MDKQKELKLVREHNANLTKMVDELRNQIDFNKTYNDESTKKAKFLINELEQIKDEWEATLEELKEKRNQYDELLEQTRKLRVLVDKEMIQRGFSRRSRRQIFRMIDKDAKQQTKEQLVNE